MPQLELITFPSQIFWVLASFSSFFFVCSGVSRFILKSESERSALIEKNLDEANLAQKEVAEIYKTIKSNLASLEKTNSQIIAMAIKEADTIISSSSKECDKAVRLVFHKGSQQTRKEIISLSKNSFDSVLKLSDAMYAKCSGDLYRKNLPSSAQIDYLKSLFAKI